MGGPDTPVNVLKREAERIRGMAREAQAHARAEVERAERLERRAITFDHAADALTPALTPEPSHDR